MCHCVALYQVVLDRVQRDHGRDALAAVLGSLAVTSDRGPGLTSREMVLVLQRVLPGDREAAAGYIAAVVWPRLWRSLGGSLVRGPESVSGADGAVTFLHSQAQIVATQRFVPTPQVGRCGEGHASYRAVGG